MRIVEAYRENGRVRQRIIAELGRRDILAGMLAKLRRLLEGGTATTQDTAELPVALHTYSWGPLLVARRLFEELNLWELFDRLLGGDPRVRWADRAFVLIANHMIHPSIEHALVDWLETDFLCDRQGKRFLPKWHQHGRVRVDDRQLDGWNRSLDKLLEAKAQIETALYAAVT